MSEFVEIPKYDYQKNGGDLKSQAPCWMDLQDHDGTKLKPTIVCKCGEPTGIGLHHVHSDGRITASYYHLNLGGAGANDRKGCGWHVYLKLKDYHGKEFLPNE